MNCCMLGANGGDKEKHVASNDILVVMVMPIYCPLYRRFQFLYYSVTSIIQTSRGPNKMV